MRIAPVFVNGFRMALLLAVFILPAVRSGAQQAAASRAGILPLAAVVPLAATQRTDSVVKGHGSRRSHIAIGVGVGGLIGGAFGGVTAGSQGAGPSLNPAATAAGALAGALLGALFGGVIGAFVPHS